MLCSLNCSVLNSPVLRSFDQALLLTARYILLDVVSCLIMYPLLINDPDELLNTNFEPVVNLNCWFKVSSWILSILTVGVTLK